MMIELKADVQVRCQDGTFMTAKAGRKVNFFDKPRDGKRVFSFDVINLKTSEICRYIEVHDAGGRPAWL